jgi:hypothetical protein
MYKIKSSCQNNINYLNVYNEDDVLIYKCELFKILNNDNNLLNLIIKYNIM